MSIASDGGETNAKGVLAERGGLDMDQAFLRLRSHARNTNTRLTELARHVIDGSLDTRDILADQAQTQPARRILPKPATSTGP